MRNQQAPQPRRLLVRYRRFVGYGALLLALVLIVGLASYLHLSRIGLARSAAATPGPADLGTSSIPRTVTVHPDYIGQLVFRCDLQMSNGYCLLDRTSNKALPLVNSAVHTEARAQEPFSPDGVRMAYAQVVGGNYRILVRDTHLGWIDELQTPSLANLEPVFSPDGNRLAYVARDAQGSSLWVYDLTTASARQLTQAAGWRDSTPSWSPDGAQLVFASDRSGRTQLYLLDVDAGTVQQLGPSDVNAWDPVWIKPPIAGRAQPTAADSINALGVGLVMDPQTCRVSISAGDDSGGAPITRVVLKNGESVLHDSGAINVPTYAAEVDLKKVRPNALTLQVWNAGAYAQTPRAMRREVSCAVVPTPDFGQVAGAAAADATHVVIVPSATPVDVFAAATQAVRLTEQARTTGTPTPQPLDAVTATPTPAPAVVTATPEPANEATQAYEDLRATAVAFTTGTPTPLPTWIALATSTRTPSETPVPSVTRPPSPTPTQTYTPVFVPWHSLGPLPTATPLPPVPGILRGKILFRSNRDQAWNLGASSIFVMNADGTGVGRLTDFWPFDLAAQGEMRSQDGLFELFVRSDNSGPQIFFHDAYFRVDKQITAMGTGASWEPAFAPDGWRIAFVSNEPGNDEIYVINRDGSDLRRLTSNTWEWDRHPSWSPDGQQLVFWSNRTGRKQLYLMSPDGQHVRSISDGMADDWDPIWIK